MNKILSLVGALLLSVVASAQVVPFSISNDYSKNGQNVNLTEEEPSDSHEAVDLGLPSGLKWATCNIGANTPEEYGLYFAWGETTGYTHSDGHLFNWDSYQWCNWSYSSGSGQNTKYCTDSRYGTVDNKTVLDPEDDAALMNWGSAWRMPTYDEFNELITNCTWTWTIQKRRERLPCDGF